MCTGKFFAVFSRGIISDVQVETRVWEFGEAMENNLLMALEAELSFAQCLRRRKQCTVYTVNYEDGVLLTATWEMVNRQGEYLEDLFNSTDMSSHEEAECGVCEADLEKAFDCVHHGIL